MPLQGSVGERISELHHAQDAGTAQRVRSNKQIIAIAYASKRRDQRRSRRSRTR